MKIEVFGNFNSDGSSMSLKVYEIEDGCERVLVAPHTPRHYGNGPVWGFMKDGKQVEGRLVYDEPNCIIMG